MNTTHPASNDLQSDEHQPSNYNQSSYQSNSSGYSQRDEQEELFTVRIQGARRLFFVDLKQSHQGRYLKITEKSGGQKRTILMDEEDFVQFFKAINDINELLVLDKSEK
jgi:PurA ssDNA and RNA-binding protein